MADGFTAFKCMAVPPTAPLEGLKPIRTAEACVRAMREAMYLSRLMVPIWVVTAMYTWCIPCLEQSVAITTMWWVPRFVALRGLRRSVIARLTRW